MYRFVGLIAIIFIGVLGVFASPNIDFGEKDNVETVFSVPKADVHSSVLMLNAVPSVHLVFNVPLKHGYIESNRVLKIRKEFSFKKNKNCFIRML